jgi:hypothetical protein
MPELSWRRLPTLVLHALRYELGLYRSLGRWLVRRPDHGEPGDVPVGYARTSTPVIWLWIFGSACEIPLVHVLVPWHGVRIALLAVGVWGLVWMVGLLASLWVHPHLLTPTGLRVRNGAGHDVRVPWTAVTGVTTRRRDLPSSMWALQPADTPEGTVLQVAVSGQVNVHLALRGPTEVVTAKGPMTVTAVSFFADDAREAAGLVREALSGTGSAPRRPPSASSRDRSG